MVPSVYLLISVMIISVNVKKDSPENTAKKVHHSDKLHFSRKRKQTAATNINVCNRRLFSFPAKVEMAEEQEYL